VKISTNKQALLTAINKVIKATASRPSVPYLSGIKITVTENEVSFFASDLETSIQTQVDCLIEKTGTIAVAGKILSNIVNALPDTTVEIFEDGEFLKIAAGQSQFEIRKIKTSDFSDFPQLEGNQKVMIPADTLSTMVKKVGKAVSRDEGRVVLTGILLTVEGDSITMVATDSFRLALVDQKLEQLVDKTFEVLIPGKIFEEVARMVPGNDLVGIESSSNQILFTFGDTQMVTRRLEGKFPNYKQLIPSGHSTRVVVGHAELVDSVKRVSLFALVNAAISVQVSTENQTLSLDSKTQDLGSAHENVLVKVEGKDNEIAINYSYFMDGLNSINSDTVHLEIQDPLRPGIVRAPEENFTYLVMPVRAQ